MWIGNKCLLSPVRRVTSEARKEIMSRFTRKNLCILIGLFMWCESLAYASGQCYTAIPVDDQDGKELPIDPACRVLERNLNEFCDEPPQVCGIKISPKFAKELTIPKWVPVNLGGKLDLVESIIRSPWEGAPDQNASQVVWDDERGKLEAAFRENRLSVSTTKLDFFQLGEEIKGFRLDPGDCESNNSRQLDSRDPDWWNAKLTRPDIKVWPAPEEIRKLRKKYRSLGSAMSGGDILLIRGRPYWYVMYGYYEKDADMTVINSISVDQGINQVMAWSKRPTLSVKNVCDIKYKATENTP